MESPPSRTPSSEDQVAVVEPYFNCAVRKDFEALPIAADYTIVTPLPSKLELEGGRVTGEIAFYDPRRLVGRTADRP